MYKNIRHITMCLLLLLSGISNSIAQQLNVTLQRDYLWDYENALNDKNQTVQTFTKPYRYATLQAIKDSSLGFPTFIKDASGRFRIVVVPVVNALAGYQNTSAGVITSDLAIGGNIMADFGKKLSANLKVLSGIGVYDYAADSLIRHAGVVPGMGPAYRANGDSLNARYSYQYFSGYVSYSPHKIFNVQLGRDKHFWGDGLQSLFLSDVAAPYPFLKLTTNIWKITYVNMYAMMKDATNPSGLKKDWTGKYATFHYLGINISKRINFGIFESIVWQSTDSTRNRGYDVNYLSPVVFFRPVEYSLGSSDNSMLGFSTKIKLFKKQQLYAQLIIDDMSVPDLKKKTGSWLNKQGVQLGFKNFDLFKINGLNFQTEFNTVKPYTYSHGSVQQNYAHMNQPLAHSLGANFMEWTSLLNYRYKRFFTEAKCSMATYGIDTAGSDYGKNIFISYTKHPNELNNKIGQGVKTKLVNISFKASWMVDSKMNLRVELGINARVEQNAFVTKQTSYVFAGIRTDLCNLYSAY